MSTSVQQLQELVQPQPQAAAIATKFIQAGGHVIFFPRGTKRCTVPGWEEKATNHLETALAWAEKDPFANVGIVGKQDGLWGLDDDGGLIAEYEEQYGPIQTYTTRTVSGGRHFIFHQNAESWAMGNITIKDAGGRELLSARVDDRYVLSAGSWAYPNNDEKQPLTQYTAVDRGAPFIEAPTSLLDFIKAKAAQYGGAKPKAQKATDETETNKPGFISRAPVWVQNIRAADGDIEAVLAQTPDISEGGRNNTLTSVGGKLHQIGWSDENVRQCLLRINQDKCHPPLPAKEVETTARSVCRYEVKEPGKIVFPEQAQAPAQAAQSQELNNEEEETFSDQQEQFPECPIFTGPLTELAKALYPCLPLEFKQFGLITRWGLLRSGIDKLRNEPHLQPRSYVIMVGKPNSGKTGSNNETRNAMELIVALAKSEISERNKRAPTLCVFGDFKNQTSVDSGPALVEMLYNLSKKIKSEVTTDTAAKMMLDPDEISDVFEKARTTNGRVSTLFHELLKLHSVNRTANSTKKAGNLEVKNGHISMFGGTTVQKYPSLWVGTGGGGDGLMSRFIPITTNAPPVPPIQLPSTAEVGGLYQRLARLAILPPQEIIIGTEAAEMLDKWWESVDKTRHVDRVLEAMKQLLIVLTVTNAPEGHTGTELTVGPDLMAQAIQFGDYVIAVRQHLNPFDSWTNVQAMENAIIKWMQDNSKRKLPRSRNDCRRGVHPQHKPGGLGAFKQAWENCVGTGVLKVREKTQRDNKYSL